jgi:hypothetical protein
LLDWKSRWIKPWGEAARTAATVFSSAATAAIRVSDRRKRARRTFSMK